MICHNGYSYFAVNISVSTEEDAINAMLLEFGGEDVELVEQHRLDSRLPIQENI